MSIIIIRRNNNRNNKQKKRIASFALLGVVGLLFVLWVDAPTTMTTTMTTSISITSTTTTNSTIQEPHASWTRTGTTKAKSTNTTTTTTLTNKESMAAKYSLCRATTLSVPTTLQQQRLQQQHGSSSSCCNSSSSSCCNQDEGHDGVGLLFQNVTVGTPCQGHAYDAFTTALLTQVHQQQQQQQQQEWWSWWGQRTRVLPPGSKVLLVGSKYMARLATVWACQQVTTTTTTAVPVVTTIDTSRDGMVTKWRFTTTTTTTTTTDTDHDDNDHDDDSSELWVVADSYFWFGGPEAWQSLLEQQLSTAFSNDDNNNKHVDVKLADFDAVLVGLPQECHRNDTSQYSTRMQQHWQQLYPAVDCFTNAPPTLVPNWTAVYDGPMALVTLPNRNLAHLEQQMAWDMRKYVMTTTTPTTTTTTNPHDKKNSNPTTNNNTTNTTKNTTRTLGIVSSSRWMDRLTRSGTCHHHEQQLLCKAGAGTTRRPCVGAYGGITDVVVWDVVEFLYHAVVVVPKNKKVTTKNNQEPASLGGLWSPNNDDATPTVTTTTACPSLLSGDTSVWPSVSLSSTPRRICRDRSIVVKPDILATPVQITYWCQGTQYDTFGKQLETYIETQEGPPALSLSWGRRPLPFPARKRILVIGNSHTRQVLYSLLCQYQDLLQAQTEIHVHGPIRYEFCHDSTVVTVFNSHVPYSRQWKKLLEQEIKEPLENFDAIVLGLFNHCGGPNGFSVDMERITADMPEVDCLNISPPSVLEWAAAFRGAILFVSMFSTNQQDEVNQARRQIETLQSSTDYSRTNVAFVDARRHVIALQNECASYNRTSVMDCVVDVGEENDIYVSAHRCVGPLGGHPDLVSWDVVEQLHALLN